MLTSLLYVSRSRMPERVVAESVQQIIAASEIRNRKLGVTGAVLFTGQHFAQIVEGERAAIDALWGDIRRDIRHDGVIVVERKPVAERRFADWSMAFFAPSNFVTRQVKNLTHERSEAHYARTAKWLSDILAETCGRTTASGDTPGLSVG